MERDQEYWRLAADALTLAESARNENDRASWLRLARAWGDLARQKNLFEAAFDSEAMAKGSGQDPSTNSHYLGAPQQVADEFSQEDQNSSG